MIMEVEGICVVVDNSYLSMHSSTNFCLLCEAHYVVLEIRRLSNSLVYYKLLYMYVLFE